MPKKSKLHNKLSLRELNFPDSNGSFSLVASCIKSCFRFPIKDSKTAKYKLLFLQGELVSHFCDLSDNFEQEKLVNKFKELNKFLLYVKQ